MLSKAKEMSSSEPLTVKSMSVALPDPSKRTVSVSISSTLNLANTDLASDSSTASTKNDLVPSSFGYVCIGENVVPPNDPSSPTPSPEPRPANAEQERNRGVGCSALLGGTVVLSATYEKEKNSWVNHNGTYSEIVTKDLKDAIDVIHSLWVDGKLDATNLQVTLSTSPALDDCLKRRADDSA